MSKYKLLNGIEPGRNLILMPREDGIIIGIPYAPDNTDYQQFKRDLANGVQLSDANNNIMTANQISEFIATLP
jgi:hypothetical protein